jgi:hypothetical protein
LTGFLLGAAWIVAVWALTLRKKWHRTSRTVGLLVAATVVLFAGLWMDLAFAWVPGVAFCGVVLFLAEVDSRLLSTMSASDFRHATLLATIDAEVSRAMSGVADPAKVEHVRARLTYRLSELETHDFSEPWQRIAELKAEEFRIALQMVSAPQYNPEQMLERQKVARMKAKTEFDSVLAEKLPFWG